MKTKLAVAALALTLTGCSASKQDQQQWAAKSNAQVIECAAESQNTFGGGNPEAALLVGMVNSSRFDACFNEFQRRANTGKISQQEYGVYMALTRRQQVTVNHTW